MSALIDFAKDLAAAIAIVIFTAGAVLALAAVATPCEYEDSTNCYWSASTQGNGYGQSFVDVAGLTIRF